MAEKSRVTTPRGRHESWCQASAVRGCVPILINPEFDAALDRDSGVTHWMSSPGSALWYTDICQSFFFFFFFFCRFVGVVWQDSDRVQSVTKGTWYSRRSSMLSSDSWLIDIGERSHPNPMHRRLIRCSSATSKTGNRFGWSFFFAVWRRCARSQLHVNSVVLVESQGSCALVRIARLQKFDRRDNMIFTVHLNRLSDENTPLEQSTIETCLQEAYKYQKVNTKISCDIWSRFEASWLDCVMMMSEMTIAVIVVSASCHHLTRADSGWSRISWFSRVTLPWLRGGTSVAPWRHKSSHVPVFRRLFDRLPVRISTSDLHHRILRKKLYHVRAYDFGVQFSFKKLLSNGFLHICKVIGQNVGCNIEIHYEDKIHSVTFGMTSKQTTLPQPFMWNRDSFSLLWPQNTPMTNSVTSRWKITWHF